MCENFNSTSNLCLRFSNVAISIYHHHRHKLHPSFFHSITIWSLAKVHARTNRECMCWARKKAIKFSTGFLRYERANNIHDWISFHEWIFHLSLRDWLPNASCLYHEENLVLSFNRFIRKKKFKLIRRGREIYDDLNKKRVNFGAFLKLTHSLFFYFSLSVSPLSLSLATKIESNKRWIKRKCDFSDHTDDEVLETNSAPT